MTPKPRPRGSKRRNMSKSAQIQLSDHFDYGKLLKFVMPSIGMMIFTSIYGVVDGFFVSNFAGDVAFAAVNLIMPFIMIFSALGFMVGTGGTALVSMKLGEGKEREAKEIFSLLVYVVCIVGVLVTIVGTIMAEDVAVLLGATEEMLPYCVLYARITLLSACPFMLQNLFQSFLVVAEKPRIGFYLTVAAGVTNMVLDGVLVGILDLQVTGAAIATVMAECVGGFVPLIYFILPNSSRLRLTGTRFYGKALLKTCTNGSSEFLTNISMSFVNMLYNKQLLKFAGSKGVAAYGVIMYVCFIFIAIFIGYSIGTAPIVGYNYGAGKTEELKNIFSKSLRLIGIFAILMLGLAMLLANPLAKLYVGYDEELMSMTVTAFRIYSISFLIMGFNVYGSSFFTALNNGAVSAAISFMRTLVFPILMVYILPLIFGINGIWLAATCVELLSLIVTGTLIIKMRDRYGYWPKALPENQPINPDQQ